MRSKPIKTLALSAALLTAGLQPAAAEYPEKPINMVVNYGAGGSTDTSARVLVDAMKSALDSEIFVSNVTGAGGTVGTAHAATAKADGYTLLYSPIGPLTVQPHLRRLSYGEEDLIPVCSVTQNPLAVMVAPDSPYQSVQDLIDAAKAGEEIVAVGPAPGSIPHIAQATIASLNGVAFKYLPVGGGPDQSKAILGGDATVATDLTSTAILFGLRPIAVIADARIDGFDVPTMAELGFDVPIKSWYGVFAPKGTSEAVVERLSAACATATQDPVFLDKMDGMNFYVKYRDHKTFAEFFKSEYSGNKQLLDLIGIKMN
ncbi:Bug family tripartite tricarboxylate transporter substrate binding protein [Marinovum sp.]|uniref:Bug family tripartite tricarboxylate transporter substrate binding protein n=1 Tax=Marinovum sp. TaxID=2024839 RepID=UPI003A911321